MQLRWKASFSATCLHAAASILEGLPIADPEIISALLPATEALEQELKASKLPVDDALPLLVNLAADYENNRELIQLAATRLVGQNGMSEAAIARLAGCVADLEAALLRQNPYVVEELSVRGRPLREQWEVRGPGLMRQIAHLSESQILPEAAEIVLVAPVVGGHGRAHLASNRVTFEAVLTNPHERLPETLRLGWLLAQLNLDLPQYSETLPGTRLNYIAQLATVPLVLSAAETVELTTFSKTLLVETLSCWHLATDAAEPLYQWWQAYQDDNIRWNVALAALDELLTS